MAYRYSEHPQWATSFQWPVSNRHCLLYFWIILDPSPVFSYGPAHHCSLLYIIHCIMYNAHSRPNPQFRWWFNSVCLDHRPPYHLYITNSGHLSQKCGYGPREQISWDEIVTKRVFCSNLFAQHIHFRHKLTNACVSKYFRKFIYWRSSRKVYHRGPL